MRSNFLSYLGAAALAAGSAQLSSAEPATPYHPPLLLNSGEVFDKDSFPPAPRSRGSQGVTRVRLSVSSDGTLENCAVTGSSGDGELDQQACNLLSAKGKFEAATEAGQRVADEVEIPIRWQLAGGATEPEIGSRAKIKFDKHGVLTGCTFHLTRNGKTQPAQDCTRDATLMIEKFVGEMEEVRGHTLVSEMQIIPDNFAPPPMAPVAAFSITRIIAEVAVTPDGSAGSCRILIDNTDVKGDDSALGDDLCQSVIGQSLGLGKPPVGLKPTVRVAQLLYVID